MSTRPFVVKAGDTAPAPRVQLTGPDGQPANLTGATIVMHLRGHDTPITCTIDGDPTAGTVRPSHDGLPVPTGDLLVLQGEVEVTFSDGTVQTFPSQGYLTVEIWPDLDPAGL